MSTKQTPSDGKVEARGVPLLPERLMPGENPGDEIDQLAKRRRPQAGSDANDGRHHDQTQSRRRQPVRHPPNPRSCVGRLGRLRGEVRGGFHEQREPVGGAPPAASWRSHAVSGSAAPTPWMRDLPASASPARPAPAVPSRWGGAAALMHAASCFRAWCDTGASPGRSANQTQVGTRGTAVRTPVPCRTVTRATYLIEGFCPPSCPFSTRIRPVRRTP